MVLFKLDSQFVKLEVVNLCGTACHRLACILNLRVSNNVSQAITAEHLHYETVKSDAHSAVRRCAVLERIEQVPKALLRILIREAQCAEHTRLYLSGVDTDGTAAQLTAVQDDVIRLCAYLARIGFQNLQISSIGAVNGWCIAT